MTQPTHITLSDTFRIPTDRAAGQRIGIVGKSGSGKTNTQRVFVTDWHARVGAFTVVDPMAQFIDLRALSNTVVAGGRQPDVPLTLEGAARLAEQSVKERLSVILDTSDLKRRADQEIIEAYLNALWEVTMALDDPAPYALLIDEGELYSPQNDTPPTREIIADIAKRGRHRKMTTVIATQRPARLDKNFFTQTSILIAHRLFSVDAKPLTEQIPMSEKELRATLARMATGEAIVVGDPAFIGDVDFIRVQMRLSEHLTPAPDRVLPVVVVPDVPAVPAAITAADPALHAQLEAQATEIKRLNGIIDTLHRDLAREREARTAAEQVNTAIPAQMALLATVTEAEQRTRVVRERVTVTEREIEESDTYISERALKLRVTAQRKAFDRMLSFGAGLTSTEKRIAAVLLTQSDDVLGEWEIARRAACQPDTAYRALLKFFKEGIVRRSGPVRTAMLYQSNLAHHLAEQYPNLETTDIVREFLHILVR